MKTSVKKSFGALIKYLETQPIENRFKGIDPFDGLNSQVFQKSFLSRSKIGRLFWVQLFKRSPLNLRPLMKVYPGYNAQALGTFVSSYCNLYKINKNEDYLIIIQFLLDKLVSLKIDGYSGACWGYNFDWQARAFYQLKSTPMTVPTAFCVNGILDAYDLLKDPELLTMADSASNFVLNDLKKIRESEFYAFSYSPLDSTVVFNASLLATQMLSRIYYYTQKTELKTEAKNSIQLCLKYQKEDGSWTYGTKPFHQWIDNFHTGYNLVCLSDYSHYTNDSSVLDAVRLGFNYYKNTFFDEKGRSRYYSNKLFPIDINNPAQLVITLDRLKLLKDNLSLVNKVLSWTIDNMQDEEGYFYYQHWKYFKIRIPYLRWSQAWMFYALSTYLKHEEN